MENNMKTLNLCTNKKQKGFTLIEIGVGLITLMVLTGLLFETVISPFLGKQRVTETSTEVTTIITGAMDWVIGREDGFNGMTVTTLSDDSYIAGTFGDGTGETPWGGDYTAGPSGADDFILEVTVTALPADACERLAAKSPQATCAATVVTYSIPIT
jgi:type II secretory pathway pseudopilin PulG